MSSLRDRYPGAVIDVVLPRNGPIVAELTGLADSVALEPLWVLRRRDLKRLATVGLLALPGALARAAARFRRSDLVYINTSVIVDYTLTARLFSSRTLLHVHEIPEGIVRNVLRGMLRWSGAELIFNSKATRAAFLPLPHTKSHVVYNGIAGPSEPEPMTYDGRRSLRVLMLGRISRIKGQDVLLSALEALPPAIRDRLEVRIVGSAFGDDAPTRALAGRIRDGGLADVVTLSPFVPDPADLFRWADIVAVPSCMPESLGRVAIEAMSYGRPPLVSAIGGLREVVEDGQTGWHVEPGNAEALSDALARIVTDPGAWATFPVAARARYEALFEREVAAHAFTAIVDAMLAGRPWMAPRRVLEETRG